MTPVFINSTSDTFTPTRSGAISSCLWEICRAAQKTGLEPWVITRTGMAEPYDWPKTIFVQYPSIPRNRVLSKLWYLHRDITGWGHVRQRAYNVRVAAAIRRAGLQGMPLVLNNDIELAVFLREEFPQATLLHLAHNRNSCHAKFRNRFCAAVDVAAAVSDDCGDWNQDYYALERIATVYPGVDLERYHPAERPPTGPIVINFVGRTDYNKGTDILLRAALLVSEKTKNFQVQILGTTHYGYSVWDEFQQTLSELSDELERRRIAVRRPGFIDRYALPDELRKARINVVPSRWDEPFGLVTVEGMASGLATVAARTGGTPEIVSSAGLLFERDNVEELAVHLMRLLEDKGAILEYARRARERAREFTWDRTWASIRALLA